MAWTLYAVNISVFDIFEWKYAVYLICLLKSIAGGDVNLTRMKFYVQLNRWSEVESGKCSSVGNLPKLTLQYEASPSHSHID